MKDKFITTLITMNVAAASVLLGCSIARAVDMWYTPESPPMSEIFTTPAVEPDDWALFIDALIEVESSGHDSIVGDGGKAIGCLQIHPATVEECNRILGHERFTLADRLSRTRSIEMFNTIQRHYNPDNDLHLALKVWNSKAPLSCHKKVMEIYNRKNKEL